MRPGGALMLLAAVVAGGIGVLWALLAVVGREWDYCAGGGGCIPGELMGLGIAGIAVVVGWFGLRLAKRE